MLSAGAIGYSRSWSKSKAEIAALKAEKPVEAQEEPDSDKLAADLMRVGRHISALEAIPEQERIPDMIAMLESLKGQRKLLQSQKLALKPMHVQLREVEAAENTHQKELASIDEDTQVRQQVLLDNEARRKECQKALAEAKIRKAAITRGI